MRPLCQPLVVAEPVRTINPLEVELWMPRIDHGVPADIKDGGRHQESDGAVFDHKGGPKFLGGANAARLSAIG